MDILLILGVLWVAYVSYSMAKKDGKRGLITLIFIFIASAVWALGDRFGFDGGIAAVILSGVFLVGFFIYDRFFQNKKDK